MTRGAHEEFVEFDTVEGPSDRKFGLTVGGLLLAFAAVRWLLGHGGWVCIVAASIGTVLVLLCATMPRVLRPLNRGWMALGTAMAMIMSPIVMLLMFLLVFTPIAIGMRLAGRDALGLRRKPAGQSYWHTRTLTERADETIRFQF
jgi:Saxitoxin biosynthesis operon protein SxtJ